MGYAFLSDEWFDEVDALNQAAGDVGVPPALQSLVLNVLVTGSPWGDRKMSIEGGLIRKDHNDDALVTITVPVDLANRLFVQNDQSAGVQGFMSGQIKVEGDMTQLMAMQGAQFSEQQLALQQQILDITDDVS